MCLLRWIGTATHFLEQNQTFFLFQFGLPCCLLPLWQHKTEFKVVKRLSFIFSNSFDKHRTRFLNRIKSVLNACLFLLISEGQNGFGLVRFLIGNLRFQAHFKTFFKPKLFFVCKLFSSGVGLHNKGFYFELSYEKKGFRLFSITPE